MTKLAFSRLPQVSPRSLFRMAAVAIVTAVFVMATLWRTRARPPAPPIAFHGHAPRLGLLEAAGPLIQIHAAAAVAALAIGVTVLIGVKGTARHRALGWAWVAAMGLTAVSSLFVKVIDPGHWSYIHFLSGWTIIALPIGVAAIRRRNLGLHRRMMTGVFVGGLVIAGALTFAPGRLMYRVFVG